MGQARSQTRPGRAEVARSRADTRVTEAELIEKVKVAFAQYYQADQAIRTTEDLHRVVHDMARVARDRYAQGRGSQHEVYKAEVEITRLIDRNGPPGG